MNIFRASPSVLAEAAVKVGSGEMKPQPVVSEITPVASGLGYPKGKAPAGIDAKVKAKAGK